MQDSLYATRPPFHCASAEAVQAAAAAESPPPLRPASLFTADSNLTSSQRHPTTSRPPRKRSASWATTIAHAAKKQRSQISEALSQPQVGTGAATRTKPTEIGRLQSHAGPRRLVPQQSLPVENLNIGATSSRQGVPRRIVPEEVTGSDQHTTSSDSKRGDPSACQVSRKQQACEHAVAESHHVAASQHLDQDDEEDHSLTGDSSSGGSGEGPEEASELEGDEGSDGGSDEGQPSKVIADFGAAGDAWWHDFIAAKEDMLNTVLLVRPCILLQVLAQCDAPTLKPSTQSSYLTGRKRNSSATTLASHLITALSNIDYICYTEIAVACESRCRCLAYKF